MILWNYIKKYESKGKIYKEIIKALDTDKIINYIEKNQNKIDIEMIIYNSDNVVVRKMLYDYYNGILF